MIKIKWMNYDASEYKMLEEELNTLSMNGYTCNSIDLLTVFKKTDTKAKYLTDIFYSTESTQFAKRKEKDAWISNYIDYGYHYIGKSRNIYIFKATNAKNKVPDDALRLLPYFKGTRTILKMILLFISIILSLYFISTVFGVTNIEHFITNGSIIIYYIPIVICLTLTFRAMMNYYNNVQIKQKLKNKEAPILTNQNKYCKFRLVYLYILSISILLLIMGVVLDSIERQILPINSNILTLEDFGVTGNKKEFSTYTKSSSIYVPYFYSYIEQGGEIDIENGKYGNLLSTKYYTLKDQTMANSYLDTYLYDKTKIIKPLENNTDIYLMGSSNTNIFDTMIIKKDTTLIIIATSFDLSLLPYQNVIINHYQKIV